MIGASFYIAGLLLRIGESVKYNFRHAHRQLETSLWAGSYQCDEVRHNELDHSTFSMWIYCWGTSASLIIFPVP
jgi:hypothetical protein